MSGAARQRSGWVHAQDFQVIVIEDCVASRYGDDLHVFGLEQIKRCMGWVKRVAAAAARS